jgi:adenosine deaminase
MVVKAELHCHIEGAASPELVLRQARKYGADVSRFINGNTFVWHDFTSFLAAYDASAALFRSEEDYSLLAETYLSELAGYDAIYSEIFVSPDHARSAGLSPAAYVAALGEGMKRARELTGIESRMIVIGVRHFGTAAVEAAARFAADCGHPLVTGFGMAGEERFGDPADYIHAFDLARDAGLGITVHAGELAGWESVKAALDNFHPSRIGHGVRAIENPALVRRIADEGIVLECCPGSNIALKVFSGFNTHPFPALSRAGCKVTLNSDDPPYFWTSLQREYDIARTEFGMDDEALAAVTRTALDAAFIDDQTRNRLIKRASANSVAHKTVTEEM